MTTSPVRLTNSTLVYQPTLFKSNLSIKKLVVIMLIYEDERRGPVHQCGPLRLRGPIDFCGPKVASLFSE